MQTLFLRARILLRSALQRSQASVQRIGQAILQQAWFKNLSNQDWLQSWGRRLLVRSDQWLNRLEQIPAERMRRFGVAVLGITLFGTVTAVAVAPLNPISLSERELVVEELELPSLNEQLLALEQESLSFIREEDVRNGDTLAALLARMQIEDAEALRFLRDDKLVRQQLQLKRGRTLQAQTDEYGKLLWLRYFHTPAYGEGEQVGAFGKVLTVRRQGTQFNAQEEKITNEKRTEVRAGNIRSSLYASTDAAGVPDAVAKQMIEIFSGDIDFHRDLKRDDQFRVVYEVFYQNGEPVRSGRVLGLEFYANKKWYQAVWHDGAYYTFDGKSMKKAFLRSPMQFTRITSGFSMRLHPILKTWREHKGVDYAAPSGTPIFTVADGTVDFVGIKGGYGNVVVIKHHDKYSTLYAHMSAFASGLKKGSKVQQGTVIGYVGQTGWATGPHLHYEFLIDGIQHDPLKIALPESKPIAPQQLAAFRQATAAMRHQLNLVAGANAAAAVALNK